MNRAVGRWIVLGIVVGFGSAFAAPPSAPVSAPQAALDIPGTVKTLADFVGAEYFDPRVAERVATSLRNSLAANAYSAASSPGELARLLTRDLYAWTHDKHLAVAVRAPVPGGGTPDQDRASSGRRTNWGIPKTEILPNNVGYLDIVGFFHPDEAGDALSASMRSLQSADALIVDLRDNLGGSPDMVALTASYLLDRPGLPLFDIVPRSGETQRYATESRSLPGSDGSRPLYVLTSTKTFSAGEGLAFLLKERHRATIIGETTAGAANPGRSHTLTDVLSVMIPNGQVRSAVGGGNWEGTGVTPDIRVPAADALREAQTRAESGFPRRKLQAGAWVPQWDR